MPRISYAAQARQPPKTTPWLQQAAETLEAETGKYTAAMHEARLTLAHVLRAAGMESYVSYRPLTDTYCPHAAQRNDGFATRQLWARTLRGLSASAVWRGCSYERAYPIILKSHMLREVQCTLECIQQNKKVPIHEWELRLKMTRSSISIQVGAVEYSSVLTIVGAVSR